MQLRRAPVERRTSRRSTPSARRYPRDGSCRVAKTLVAIPDASDAAHRDVVAVRRRPPSGTTPFRQPRRRSPSTTAREAAASRSAQPLSTYARALIGGPGVETNGLKSQSLIRVGLEQPVEVVDVGAVAHQRPVETREIRVLRRAHTFARVENVRRLAGERVARIARREREARRRGCRPSTDSSSCARRPSTMPCGLVYQAVGASATIVCDRSVWSRYGQLNVSRGSRTRDQHVLRRVVAAVPIPRDVIRIEPHRFRPLARRHDVTTCRASPVASTCAMVHPRRRVHADGIGCRRSPRRVDARGRVANRVAVRCHAVRVDRIVHETRVRAPTGRRTSRGRARTTRSAAPRIARSSTCLSAQPVVVVVQERAERAVAQHVAQLRVHELRARRRSSRCRSRNHEKSYAGVPIGCERPSSSSSQQHAGRRCLARGIVAAFDAISLRQAAAARAGRRPVPAASCPCAQSV